MFAPSFFTGDVIKRVGALKVMQTGAVLMIICVAINLFGTDLHNFWIALFMLGIGWNFLFVGATTLLTETYRPAERALVQATNDFLIFGSVAIASIMSGIVLEKLSWQMVNVGVLPFVAATLAATGWLGWRRRTSAVTEAVPSTGPKSG
jgi:MFS family permease